MHSDHQVSAHDMSSTVSTAGSIKSRVEENVPCAVKVCHRAKSQAHEDELTVHSLQGQGRSRDTYTDARIDRTGSILRMIYFLCPRDLMIFGDHVVVRLKLP